MAPKKLLYIMGIDWKWIYQRPQLFAEKLARDYEVTVVFPRSILSAEKGMPIERGLIFRILWTIPYQEKMKVPFLISNWVNKKVFEDIESFDYIYVGYPLYARYIPRAYRGKIIYDCMDNHKALYPDQKRVRKIIDEEEQLVKRCDLLTVSSKQLQEKMDAVAGCHKSILIRNGAQIEELYPLKKPEQKEIYKIGYIGTISEWFDYPLLQDSVRKNSHIQYHIIGPTICTVEQERIVYEGTVPHKQLGNIIEDYDCLIMPFKITEIVLSVDPVKLYEYIAFGKCIISVYYPEVERFQEFVYFYRKEEEFHALINDLSQKGFPPKYDAVRQQQFLYNNTWDERYKKLIEKMK